MSECWIDTLSQTEYVFYLSSWAGESSSYWIAQVNFGQLVGFLRKNRIMFGKPYSNK